MLRARPGRPSDAPDIVARLKTANTLTEIEDQLRLFSDQPYSHIVVEAEEGVVGNALLLPSRFFPLAQHRGELADFIVAAEHRGGRASMVLLDAVRAEAIRRGMTQLDTATRSGGPSSAFTRLGFTEWGRMPRAERLADGTYREMIFFSMPLD